MTCPTCNGSGGVPDPSFNNQQGDDFTECPDCFGKGVVPSDTRHRSDIEPAEVTEPSEPTESVTGHFFRSVNIDPETHAITAKPTTPADEPEITFDIEGKLVDAKTFLAAVDAAPTEPACTIHGINCSIAHQYMNGETK